MKIKLINFIVSFAIFYLLILGPNQNLLRHTILQFWFQSFPHLLIEKSAKKSIVVKMLEIYISCIFSHYCHSYELLFISMLQKMSKYRERKKSVEFRNGAIFPLFISRPELCVITWLRWERKPESTHKIYSQ